ncbi:phosphoglycolate phosphatase [Flavobacteriales bacterium]|nr:phosphoglycolate phosphatase [Flavobacteriales bacterium]
MDFCKKELIIFDFDGTLIDSIPDLTLALNRVLARYQLPTLTVEQASPFVGNGARLLLHRALVHAKGSKDISNDLFEDALNVYHAAYKENTCVHTYLYPGVFETLESLKRKGYTLAICTNKPFDYIEPILEKLEIKSFFKYWIGEDSLCEKKPSAIPLLHLADKTNISVDKCLMVGDSKNDILAAKNAGMQSVGVTYGYNYNEQISDYNPDVVLDQISDLMEVLE